jgi:hypothetical protein
METLRRGYQKAGRFDGGHERDVTMEGERESFSNASAHEENHSKHAVNAGNCARLDRGFLPRICNRGSPQLRSKPGLCRRLQCGNADNVSHSPVKIGFWSFQTRKSRAKQRESV